MTIPGPTVGCGDARVVAEYRDLSGIPWISEARIWIDADSPHPHGPLNPTPEERPDIARTLPYRASNTRQTPLSDATLPVVAPEGRS